MYTPNCPYPTELMTMLDAHAGGYTPTFRGWYAKLVVAVETYNGKHSTTYDPGEVIDYWAEEHFL